MICNRKMNWIYQCLDYKTLKWGCPNVHCCSLWALNTDSHNFSTVIKTGLLDFPPNTLIMHFCQVFLYGYLPSFCSGFDLFHFLLFSPITDSRAVNDAGIWKWNQPVWHSWGVCCGQVSAFFIFFIIHCYSVRCRKLKCCNGKSKTCWTVLFTLPGNQHIS